MKKKTLNTRLTLVKKTILSLSDAAAAKGGGTGGGATSVGINCDVWCPQSDFCQTNDPFCQNSMANCPPQSDFCDTQDKYCQAVETIFIDCKK